MSVMIRICAVILCFISTITASQPLEVITPPKQASNDNRNTEIIEILRTALDKTTQSDGSYMLKESEYTSMNAWRYTYQLAKNDNDAPNVVWLPASEDLDKELRPIPIPILKGLLGIRVLLIKQEDQKLFDDIDNKEDLKKLIAGQGATWLDVDILRANGFTVETGFDYQGLFNMLEYRRFDYFPRGVNEVLPEFSTLPANLTDIVIEKTIVLQYPYPVYFYVNKNNKKLARRIEEGLNIMLNDGSLDEILNTLYLKNILALNIPNRKVISLDNPLLNEKQQMTYSDFWLNKLYTK